MVEIKKFIPPRGLIPEVTDFVNKYSASTNFLFHEHLIRNMIVVGKPAVPSLIKSLDQKNADLQVAIGKVLAGIGVNGRQLGEITDMLRSHVMEERRGAAAALAEIAKKKTRPKGFAKSVSALIQALNKDNNQGVRAVAAFALGNAGYKKAVPSLIAALNSPFILMRSLSAEALGKIGDTVSLPALRRLSRSDPHQLVRDEAKTAINNILRHRIPVKRQLSAHRER